MLNSISVYRRLSEFIISLSFTAHFPENTTGMERIWDSRKHRYTDLHNCLSPWFVIFPNPLTNIASIVFYSCNTMNPNTEQQGSRGRRQFQTHVSWNECAKWIFYKKPANTKQLSQIGELLYYVISETLEFALQFKREDKLSFRI